MVKRKPVYIAVVAITLDGKIARSSSQKGWTSPEDQVHLHKTERLCDVLVMGRKSYALAKSKLAKKSVVVFTSSIKKIEEKSKNLVYLNPSVINFKKYVWDKNYKRVCILGGTEVYSYFLERNNIDELWVTIEPIVFGAGIGIFSGRKYSKTFYLKSAKNSAGL